MSNERHKDFEETYEQAARRLIAVMDARLKKKASEGLNAPRNFQNTRKPQWVGEGQVAGVFPRLRYLPNRPGAPEAELPMRIRVAANCNRRVHLRPHLGYGSE